MREDHEYRLEGGSELTTMGATWFVSYCYYKMVDSNHKNWNRVSTASNRASVFARSQRYYKYWLTEVLNMADANLNRNSLGLKSTQIKQMASEILKKMQ